MLLKGLIPFWIVCIFCLFQLWNWVHLILPLCPWGTPWVLKVLFIYSITLGLSQALFSSCKYPKDGNTSERQGYYSWNLEVKGDRKNTCLSASGEIILKLNPGSEQPARGTWSTQTQKRGPQAQESLGPRGCKLIGATQTLRESLSKLSLSKGELFFCQNKGDSTQKETLQLMMQKRNEGSPGLLWGMSAHRLSPKAKSPSLGPLAQGRTTGAGVPRPSSPRLQVLWGPTEVGLAPHLLPLTVAALFWRDQPGDSSGYQAIPWLFTKLKCVEINLPILSRWRPLFSSFICQGQGTWFPSCFSTCQAHSLFLPPIFLL